MNQNLANFQKIVFDNIGTGTGCLCSLFQTILFTKSDDNDSGIRESRFNLSGCGEPACLLHLDVHQNPIGSVNPVGHQRLRAVGAFSNLSGKVFDDQANHPAHLGAVVNNQNVQWLTHSLSMREIKNE
jgi:hypothetical protein